MSKSTSGLKKGEIFSMISLCNEKISPFFSKTAHGYIPTGFVTGKTPSTNIPIGKYLFEISSNISLILKEHLTAIKGFSQLLLKEYNEELSNQVVNKIENIYEQCMAIESKISNSQRGRKLDVLLIEDGRPTMRYLEEIFKKRGYSFKIATTGQKGLDELKKSLPKLIFTFE